MTGANASAADLGIMAGFPPPADKRITLENWDSPPFNRWSFQNIRSILPTRIISRGTGPVSAFPRAIQPLDEVTFTDLDGAGRSVGLIGVIGPTRRERGSQVSRQLSRQLRQALLGKGE